MSLLSYIVEATARDQKHTIEGTTTTRPSLIYTDGLNVTYACDVDIGEEGVINENGDIGMLPLKNVPIANNNRELIYAEVGTPVTLSKSGAGKWEIIGLAKTSPGTFVMVPVTLPDFCHGFPSIPGNEVPPIEIEVGDPVEISYEIRVLTYEEMITYGVYGIMPYGAIGVFREGELVEIRSM